MTGVQIHGQNAVSAGGGHQIGHQLGRDRRASAGFAILPGIAEIGQHRRDPPGRGAVQRIDADQQFHQMVVGRVARRLDDEHVLAADILVDRDEDLVVGEALHRRLGERRIEIVGDGGRKRPVGVARQQLHRKDPSSRAR
jgi:hypothetical protein